MQRLNTLKLLFLIVTLLSLVSCINKNKKNLTTEIITSNIINGSIPSSLADSDIALSTVALSYNSRSLPHCSGVLIAPNIVLTAAHCIQYKNVQMYATMGTKITINQKTDDLYEVENSIAVLKVISHPDYIETATDLSGDINYLNSDLALVILSKKVSLPFKPIPIYSGVDVSSIIGLPLYVAGFSPYSASSIKDAFDYVEFKESKSEVFRNNASKDIDQTIVELLYRSVTSRPYDKKQTVFKDSISYDQFLGGICSGDSGGPTFIRLNNKFYLLGINSFTLDGERSCSTIGSSTVVSFHQGWIQKALQGESLVNVIEFQKFSKIQSVQNSLTTKNFQCSILTQEFIQLFLNLPGFNAPEDIQNNCNQFKTFLKVAKKKSQLCHTNCLDSGATKGFCTFFDEGVERLKERTLEQCTY